LKTRTKQLRFFVKFPINVDDAKSIKNISKTQLVEVIKSLKEDIEALQAAQLESKPTSKPENEIKSSVSTNELTWNNEQLSAFLLSQDEVINSVKCPAEKKPEPKDNPSLSNMYEKMEYDSRKPGVITHVFDHDSGEDKQSQKTILKLDPNTSKFHGNVNEDVDDWLHKVKINLDIAQIPADKYFDYLTNYCVGKAGTFMRRLRESYEKKFTPLTWLTFRESFIKRYKPFEHVRRIRNQLIQLRQGNDFNSYVDNFQQLLNQVESREFSPQEKLHYFTEGLQHDTRFQVVSKQCTSVETAILVASDSCVYSTICTK
jgi:hypothetical protein